MRARESTLWPRHLYQRILRRSGYGLFNKRRPAWANRELCRVCRIGYPAPVQEVGAFFAHCATLPKNASILVSMAFSARSVLVALLEIWLR